MDKFETQILGKDKKPLILEEPKPGEEPKYATLRDLSEIALLEQYSDEQGLSTTKKVERYKLFNRISDGANFNSLAEGDKTLLRELIGKRFPVLLVGRAYAIMDETK